MSDGKPGLFSRLRAAISSTLNEAVDSVTDPGQELALMLDDLAAQIKKAEGDHKQAIVDRKVLEKKADQLARDEAAWMQRAEQALRLGDERLARAALERRQEISEERKHTDVALVDQVKIVEDMAIQIEEAKRKLKALNLRRGSLMAQARANKDSGGASGSVASSAAARATSRIDEIEHKIATLEAMNEAGAELAHERVRDAALEAQLASLGGASEVDDELAALKAKMAAGGQKALRGGSDRGER